MSMLTELPVWKQLQAQRQRMEDVHMRDLFDQDPGRFARFSLEFGDILFDFSKNRITEETLALLYRLARETGVAEAITAMFDGAPINHTEHRAALHIALRDQSGRAIKTEGHNVMPEVRAELKKIRDFSEAVRTRAWRGSTGQPITDVVSLGVGGSDLGPVMVTEALRPYALHDLRVHFVSNVDESHITDTLEALKPETTLFIVVSKSFTTQDTMVNAETARKWLLNGSEDMEIIRRHMVAVTSNIERAAECGIPEENVFGMWDWVGGRYSLWSAVGLSIAIAVGMDHFEAMLAGAHEMDEHFRSAPFEQNLPVTLAMLGIWYNNFFGTQAYAILPYDQHLHRLPAYLQQLEMESNGKRVDRDGKVVDYDTCPVIFGELGITGQHAFYQMLHQGTRMVPADFIAPIESYQCIQLHHRILMSNVFAQTEALMRGRTEAEARAELEAEGLSGEELEALLPYKIFPGNKPSNTLIYKTLTPATLGALIALYEHKVFVQGVVWNINSFDQWGVELGKQLAKTILPELDGEEEVTRHDSSTNGLINHYKKHRGRQS